VYEALDRRFERILRFRMDRTVKTREMLLKEAPGALHFQDCFFRDTISKGTNAFCGGCKYYPMAYTIGGFATMADSLTAIDETVFKNKSLSFQKLHEALIHNFDGYEDVLLLCRKAKKFGNDDPLADGHARRLLTMLTDTAYRVLAQTERTLSPRIILRLSVETDTRHLEIGRRLGATPDGRLAGSPVSQNWQPSPGSSLQGLTARLNSLVKLPAGRIMSGAQNITVQRSFFMGEKGARMLAAILGAYFDMGGMQAQVSATSVEDLYDAQKNPDAHRDLMVRVTGYSAVFVDMNKAGQDDIIARDAVC
jgi:formate C-acetyltransferase